MAKMLDLKAPEWCIKLINTLADRVWDGVVLVNSDFNIMFYNFGFQHDVLEEEGIQEEMLGKSYWSLFENKKREEDPIYRAIVFGEENKAIMPVREAVYHVYARPLNVEGKRWAVGVFKYLGDRTLWEEYLKNIEGKPCLIF